MVKALKITLVKSTIGAIPQHRKTVQALGLRKLNRSILQLDNDAIRGMVGQVRHLVSVEPLEVEEADLQEMESQEAN